MKNNVHPNKLLVSIEKMQATSQAGKGRTMSLTEILERVKPRDWNLPADEKWHEILEASCDFYRMMTADNQQKLIARAHWIIDNKSFVFHDDFDEDRGHSQLLVAASVGRMILSRSPELLKNCHHFVIYSGFFINDGVYSGRLGQAEMYNRGAFTEPAASVSEKMGALLPGYDALLQIFIQSYLGVQSESHLRRHMDQLHHSRGIVENLPALSAQSVDAEWQEFSSAAELGLGAAVEAMKILMEFCSEKSRAALKVPPSDFDAIISQQSKKSRHTFTFDDLRWLILDHHMSAVDLQKFWQKTGDVYTLPTPLSSIVHLPIMSVKTSLSTPSMMNDVCVHEVAHCIDYLDGIVDGKVPTSLEIPKDWSVLWEQYLKEKLKTWDSSKLKHAYEDHDLPGEFFARVCETFFNYPTYLQKRDPAAYQLLRDFYQYDPPQQDVAAWRLWTNSFIYKNAV